MGVLILAFCCNSLSLRNVSADESQDASQDDYKVELSPVSKRMSFKPGEQKKDSLQLTNAGAKAVSVDVYAVAYYTEDNSTVKNEDLDDVYTQMSQWVTFKDDSGEYHHKISFVLYPNQQREVRYAVDVPAEAKGGGQYAILFAEFVPAKARDEEASIVAHSRVGMALFAFVDDEGILRSVEISDIRTPSSVILNHKVGVSYAIKNTGNIDFQTSTEVTVRSIFGKEIYHDIVVETVFPERTKDVSAEWEETPAFGIFRLDYAIRALDAINEGSQWILVLSSGAIVLLIFILIVVGILIKYLRLKRAHAQRAKILRDGK